MQITRREELPSSNVDMDITKSTLLKVGVAGSLDKKNEPRNGRKRLGISHAQQSYLSSCDVFQRDTFLPTVRRVSQLRIRG